MEVKQNTSLGLDQLLDPQSSVWQQVPATTIPLEGTPAAFQPTEAIRTTWSNKEIGSVHKVAVQALHNGKEVAFRLEWDAPTRNITNGDNSIFPDGAAIAFPTVENAPVMMGAPNMPINIWFWRASEGEQANNVGASRQIDAQGIGTSDTIDKNQVKSKSSWQNGKWTVVIARSLQVISSKPVAQLNPGQNAQYAVAIWDGSKKERGGLKSYSGMTWLNLTLTA